MTNSPLPHQGRNGASKYPKRRAEAQLRQVDNLSEEVI